MLDHTKSSYHFGIGCFFTPMPVVNTDHSLTFQKHLSGHGLSFSNVSVQPNGLTLVRSAPPLEVRLHEQGPGLGNLTVLAPRPQRLLESFTDEVRTVVDAFADTWPGTDQNQVQTIAREATIACLYDVPAEHAFQYLWEQRLGGRESEIHHLRRPVLGGGIRLVIPAATDGVGDPWIQVRVESFFEDARKLFVEVVMRWQAPVRFSDVDFGELLSEAERYATTEVVAFVKGDSEK